MGTIREEVRERGFAFRSSYHHTLDSAAVAAHVGTPVALGSGDPVHALVPAPSDQRTPNSYSGLYGLSPFPLHTDLAHHRMPPRYFMLRCLVGDETVGTTLVDSAAIVASVGFSLLSRGLVQPRRFREGVRPLLRLFDPTTRLFRWDVEFVRPASDAGTEAVDAVNETLARQSEMEIRLNQPGDTLVIDNWRMLHGRTAVLPSSRRYIERVYLESLN